MQKILNIVYRTKISVFWLIFAQIYCLPWQLPNIALSYGVDVDK